MITGYITKITETAHLSDVADRLAELPPAMKERILAYSHREDHLARLCGKIMLARLIADHGLQNQLTLADMQYGEFAKPYFDAPFYFNTAHSGAYAVCVASAVSAVGVDIEKIKETNIDVFRDHFTDKEWLYIRSSNDRVAAFYELWVRKEAVTKAAGMGVFQEMVDISGLGDKIVLDNKKYSIHYIPVLDGYVGAVASGDEAMGIFVQEISMNELLKYTVPVKPGW